MFKHVLLSSVILLSACATQHSLVEIKIQHGEYSGLSWDLRATATTEGTFVGTTRQGSAIKYEQTYEDVEQELSELPYVLEVAPIDPNKVTPIYELIVGFGSGLAPTTETLLGMEIIDRIEWGQGKTSLVLQSEHNQFTAELLKKLVGLPGVRYVEPNYQYSLPENE